MSVSGAWQHEQEKKMQTWLLYCSAETRLVMKKIKSDNGYAFCSAKSEEWARKQGIYSMFSAPYHTEADGSAELAIRNIK